MSYPIISRGSKIGIHCMDSRKTMDYVREAKARGIVIPLVKGTGAGLAPEVKAVDPRILTITRFVNDDTDQAGGVENWSQAEMIDHARHLIAMTVSKLGVFERRDADWIEILNEADPPGVHGWEALGRYMVELVKEADRARLRIALPALNYGTPEWEEMVALCGTGVFGLMKQGGHILTIHEGVAPFSNDFLAFGAIPGAPAIPNAGPTAWRYRYLNYILARRQEMVGIVVSEFYAGGGYDPSNARDVQIRMAIYDREVRKDSSIIAVCPFTADPGAGWMHQDYTPFYPALLNYMELEKNVANSVEIPSLIGKVKVKPFWRTMRARPNLDGVVVGYAPGGATLETIAQIGDWLKVREVWIHKSGVDPL